MFMFPAASSCPAFYSFWAPLELLFSDMLLPEQASVATLPFLLNYLENPTYASTCGSSASIYAFLVLILIKAEVVVLMK